MNSQRTTRTATVRQTLIRAALALTILGAPVAMGGTALAAAPGTGRAAGVAEDQMNGKIIIVP